MSTPLPWRILSDEPLTDCRVFRVDRARAQSPKTGETHTFFRLVAPDWVNVLPLTPDRRIVMVRQFRHGSRDMTLEIPGGMVDPGETPEAAGVRELREETGYVPARVERIGAVNPNPALFDNVLHTYLAHDVSLAGPVRNEGAEETHVVLVPLDEIPARIRAGEISHALVVAAFHWYGLTS